MVSQRTQTEILIEEIENAGFHIYKFSIEGEEVASTEECEEHRGDQHWQVEQTMCCDMMGVFIEKTYAVQTGVTFEQIRVTGYILVVYGNGIGELVSDYSYKYTGEKIIAKYGEAKNTAWENYNAESKALINKATQRVEEMDDLRKKVEELGGEVEWP
mgnify:CR=1 FL=1